MARHKDDERDKMMKETRERLLSAAAEEFAGQGYEKANINRISLAAGFAKGTIYNYFPSKRALLMALVAEIAEGHIEFITRQVSKESAPPRRLERFFEAGFAFVVDNLRQGQLMVNTLYGPDDEFKMVLYEAYQPLFQFVGREIITPGIAQGAFRPVDPEAMATLVMTLYLGTASQVNPEGRPWLDPGVVADFALKGLGIGDRGSGVKG